MTDLKDIQELSRRLEAAREYLHIQEATERLVELDKECSKPDFWNDSDRAQAISKQASDTRSTIQAFNTACSVLEDIRTACDLADEERIKEIRKTLPKGIPAQLISSVSGKGLQELKDLLWKALNG